MDERPDPSAYVGDVARAEPLGGGFAHHVWRVTTTGGRSMVLKASDRVPPDLFEIEAEGLRELRARAGVRTPDVIEVGPRHLLLEGLESGLPDADEFWEAAGRATAGIHAVRGDRFGWGRDGWLGLLRQRNAWAGDGFAFFAAHRLLRYLDEPRVRQALDADDRARLERLCARLPVLLPPAPCVLTHGDLWRGNLVATAAGEPVFIDPAVCWMWAETDLSMIYCTGGVPGRFFDAYQEISPLPDGWRERMPLLNLRELLSVLAHLGPGRGCLAQIRKILHRFA
ncbi:fructosamine kinase family protein [Bailinhaonella thermotolerans]|uniref:Aminoglycoside phosphotransferase n=1 Tax=Bailinhaonella thermotolerans TaxID=1070861 RepID=A0A3A4BQ43_9ACTN|nr:fructosamine kinase family protein [Bailinhaonella thermotolerans]RJL33266.1 aminoglycoside phosphotransferase [Bailinhaonella thermotolerans]